jgi:bifunctional oligoribonuclease and PAP phosphatase NrnA
MRISEHEFGACVGKYSNVLYLCHRNADPDAIGSAFALARAFGGTVAAVDDLSRTGEAAARIIGAEVLINPRADAYDLTVIVDTSVRLQLGEILPEKYALVDHHLDEGMLDGAEFYIQKPSKSTAEIVWTILKENGKTNTLSREMALGLVVGMISDTGRFKRASPGSFRAAAELLELGKFDYEEALQALSVPQDLSQRIAVLKAASRAEIERQGDWLVASTQINSFEGSAAMALVDLGADVAFAAGRHGDRVRISARSSRAAARMGLDLNELLGEVGRAHGGDGGGHRAAAALEAGGESRALLLECRKRVADRLGPV